MSSCAEPVARLKPISGFPGYWVTDSGGVYSERSQRMIKPWCSGNGYLYVSLSRDRKKTKRSVHLLVAEAFLSNRPETADVVNHVDGDPHNNAVDNLHWATRKENAQHAVDQGLWRKWDHSPLRLFEPEDIVFICDSAKKGKKAHEIAEDLGAHRTTISDIIKGKTYADVNRDTGELAAIF